MGRLSRKAADTAAAISSGETYTHPEYPLVPVDALSEAWDVPEKFSSPSGFNIRKFWLMCLRRTGAPRDTVARYNIYMYKPESDYLLAKYGYKEVMRAIEFMTSPLSKYFQYPFGLPKVVEGIEELKEKAETAPRAPYIGFVGNLTQEVGNDVKTDQ